MAIFEKTIRNQNFDTLLRKLEHAIPDSSWSAELEAGSDFKNFQSIFTYLFTKKHARPISLRQ